MSHLRILLLLGLLGWCAGCQQPAGSGTAPSLFSGGSNPWGQAAEAQQQFFAGVSDQMKNLTARLGQSDLDNQQLQTEMAGLKQKLQAAGDYNYQLKQQLADTVSQIQTVQNEKLSLEQQMLAMQRNLSNPAVAAGNPAVAGSLAAGPTGAPAQLPTAGGVPTLRANNSLMQKVSSLQLTGITTRMDGEVIRVELPTDMVFTPGTFQLSLTSNQLLQQIADVINREFPRQVIGIEGHWDPAVPLPVGVTAQQLTATQSLAVFNELVRMGLPEKQLFTLAMGANRPRYGAGAAANPAPNRRIEIVVYPETID
ncbi:MAG: OmpA family protein [Planctomycetota bacterium]